VPEPIDKGPDTAGTGSSEPGPPPGGLMAAAERFSQSIAGGYGLKDNSLGEARRPSRGRLVVTFLAITAVAFAAQVTTRAPLFTVEVAILVLIAIIMIH